MATIVKPPAPLDLATQPVSVFLAGSIEMGQAEPWQRLVEQALADREITIFNPRREQWDASWEQSIHNPTFREQVHWELQAQERASLIAMYFAPSTKAPITLLELGLSARSGRLLVCAPPGYWRRGNIQVVCDHYQIPLYQTLPELIEAVRERVCTLTNAPI